MGQILSCTKQQKEPTDANDTDTRPKEKKLKIKKKVTDKKEVHEPVTATDNATLLAASPNHADASAPVQLKENFCLLKPAPAKYPLPNRLAAKSSPRKSGDIWPSLDNAMCAEPLKLNTSDYVNSHKSEPVDQVARDLAQGNAKPATWADLHWALIGQRHLKTEMERVRAIFSWLCSLPLGENAFATRRELEKAVEIKIEHAAEALKSKSKEPAADSPEVVINEFTHGNSTYLRGFESLCRYTGLPCYTVKGLAKGVDYTVGMSLTEPTQSAGTLDKSATQYRDDSPLARLQHAWSAVFVDGRWALFDAMWATERLAVSGNRMSQISQKAAQIDTDTDMFYFNADPGKFIYSHYPFDPHWQLLNPPMTLKQFQDSVLLKPSFFTYGLGLSSHQDGVLSIHSKLIIKLSLPPSLANQLLFTFNLKVDGKNPILEGVNLSRFGIHEISRSEGTVTFTFRFPKAGRYKVTIYARRIGDNLFTDACEYRVDATGTETAAVTDKPASETGIDMPPFPPTAQSQYGPTEKAAELGLRPVGHDDCQRRCKNGVFEIRFTTVDPTAKLPRVTARLKSLLHDPSMLIDCLLVRSTEGMLPSTLGSLASRGSSGLAVAGPMVPMVAITAYLPTAGEYALEVYAAPGDADDSVSYFLVWQFMIDAEIGVALSSPVRKRLATCNLGAQDSRILEKIGIKMISHPDPLIHVPTAGSLGMVKTRSKGELMQQFMENMQKRQKTLKAVSEAGDESQQQQGEKGKPAEARPLAAEDEVQDPRSYDLNIVVEQSTAKPMDMIGQLVDISEPEEEQDRTTYLLQHAEKADLSDLAGSPATKRINFLIRIPKGDHFYKLYLYAPIDETSVGSVYLVYTYVIEAPSRLMSFEVPYFGVKWGPFPEKLQEQDQQPNEVSGPQ